MKRWIAAGMIALVLTGCTRYEPSEEMTRVEESIRSRSTDRGHRRSGSRGGGGDFHIILSSQESG